MRERVPGRCARYHVGGPRLVEDFGREHRRRKGRIRTTDLRDRLARYHADVDSAFWGWKLIWLALDSATGTSRNVAADPMSRAGDRGVDDEWTIEQMRRIGQES